MFYLRQTQESKEADLDLKIFVLTGGGKIVVASFSDQVDVEIATRFVVYV